MGDDQGNTLDWEGVWESPGALGLYVVYCDRVGGKMIKLLMY